MIGKLHSKHSTLQQSLKLSLSDFAYYVFGQEPAVAVHLALWYVLLVCHQYDVCENSLGSVYGGLSESGVLDMCLCFGCGGEWVGGLNKGRERWGGVMSV